MSSSMWRRHVSSRKPCVASSVLHSRPSDSLIESFHNTPTKRMTLAEGSAVRSSATSRCAVAWLVMNHSRYMLTPCSAMGVPSGRIRSAPAATSRTGALAAAAKGRNGAAAGYGGGGLAADRGQNEHARHLHHSQWCCACACEHQPAHSACTRSLGSDEEQGVIIGRQQVFFTA
eukprot:6349511-Prymnesium_polylepis.1